MPFLEGMTMKYEIQDDENGQDDEFEITEVRIIRETTRGRIATWTIGVWLLVIAIGAVSAALHGHYDELRWLLAAVTPLVTMAFGIYLGRDTSK
jgi:hypothetical protein